MPIYSRPDEDEEIVDINEEINVATDATPEEKTWAKRYGDLRRLMAKREQEFKDTQLKLQNSTALTVPDENDDAAIDQWVQQHPQIARIVMGLADRRANAATEGVKTRIEELNERENNLNKETAYRKVDEKHPDFFETIRHDPGFHEWLGGKSALMQNAIYGDDNDWRAANDVISLYKAENGVGEKKKTHQRTQSREAVDYIPPRGTTSVGLDKKTKFTESQIQRMSPSEYERHEAAIEEAWRNGEVLRDMTAGAR